MCLSNVAPKGATIAGLLPPASFVVISAKTQFFYQVKINSTAQLINGIFKALQKLPKRFSGIKTFVFVNESSSFSVFPTMLVLYLNDSELEERGLLRSSL